MHYFMPMWRQYHAMTLSLAYAARQTYVSASQPVQLTSCENAPWLSFTPFTERLCQQIDMRDACQSTRYMAGIALSVSFLYGCEQQFPLNG